MVPQGAKLNTSKTVVDKVSIEKLEKDFERRCQLILRSKKFEEEDWDNLETLSKDFLQRVSLDQFKSFKGYFYYGIALYRLADYENAVKAFKEAESVNSEEA